MMRCAGAMLLIVLATVPLFAAEPPAQALKKALNETMDVVFENSPPADVAAYFRNRCQIALQFESERVPALTVRSRGTTVKAALAATLAPQNLHFGIVGGVVVVGSEEFVLVKQLRQRVSIAHDGTALSEVLKRLSEETGANIILDPRQSDGAAKAAVKLALEDVPLETAVRLAVEVGNLRVVRLNNVLFATSEERAMRLRMDADGPVPSSAVLAPVPNLVPAPTVR